MARLASVQRDELPEDQRRFHDAVRAIRRRPVSGPFIVLMNSSPDLASRFAHLGHYFHSRGQADESIVSIRARSFISLIGSRALDAPYEWAAWVNWALEAGVPQQTVDAIREGRTPAPLTPEEALVADYCSQLITDDHDVSDATFEQALDHFGQQGLVELVVTLGYFAMIALPLNAFEIGMSADQMKQRRPFAPLEVRGTPWTPADAQERVLPALAVSSAARLSALRTHEDVAPERQHFLDRIVRTRGWVSPLFQCLLHSPDVAERIAAIGEFFLYESIVPAAPRALAWLVTARELDCSYTWHAGVAAARAAGLDLNLVHAVEHGKPLPAPSDAQSGLITLCLQLLRGNHHVSAAVYDAALQELGTAALVQLTATVGYVAMTSIIANAFRIAPPADQTQPAL
jgi:4-carboxymuconolactone decarboxylase